MEFFRNMWGNMGFPIPGMVTPTFDTQDLGKRITDLKAVESWLRMNLSMLQMTIQSLEMQNATLSAVQAIGGLTTSAATEANGGAQGEGPTVGETLQQAALWPWNLMQQVQAQLQKSAEEDADAAPAAAPNPDSKVATKTAATKKPAKKPAA
jgi:hypothetical protein